MLNNNRIIFFLNRIRIYFFYSFNKQRQIQFYVDTHYFKDYPLKMRTSSESTIHLESSLTFFESHVESQELHYFLLRFALLLGVDRARRGTKGVPARRLGPGGAGWCPLV